MRTRCPTTTSRCPTCLPDRPLGRLHSFGLARVQPSNILIAHDNSVRLADFGAAHSAELTPDAAELRWLEGGTLPYLAPELLSCMPVRRRSKAGSEEGCDCLSVTGSLSATVSRHTRDAYAYAITVWEGFSRQKPFQFDAKAVRAITPQNSSAGLRELVEKGDRPPLAALPSVVRPSHLEHLLCACWCSKPESRLTFSRICELFRELPVIADVMCGSLVQHLDAKFGEGKLHTRPRRPLRRPMSRSKLEADASIVTLLELPEVAMRLWPLSTNLNSEEEIVPVKLPSRNLNRGARAVSLR